MCRRTLHARARRPDEYRDGDIGLENLFDNLARRFKQAAGGVQLDDQERRALVARLVDSSRDSVGGQGFDIAVYLYDEHRRAVGGDGITGLPREDGNGDHYE